jgi:hypothetical protein
MDDVWTGSATSTLDTLPLASLPGRPEEVVPTYQGATAAEVIVLAVVQDSKKDLRLIERDPWKQRSTVRWRSSQLYLQLASIKEMRRNNYKLCFDALFLQFLLPL